MEFSNKTKKWNATVKVEETWKREKKLECIEQIIGGKVVYNPLKDEFRLKKEI